MEVSINHTPSHVAVEHRILFSFPSAVFGSKPVFSSIITNTIVLVGGGKKNESLVATARTAEWFRDNNSKTHLQPTHRGLILEIGVDVPSPDFLLISITVHVPPAVLFSLWIDF